MFAEVEGFVKTHPYKLAAGIFVIGLIVIMTTRARDSGNANTTAGTSTYTTADNSGVVAANTQLYSQQMQYQAQAAANSDQLQASLATTAAQVTLGQGQEANDAAANNLSAAVSQAQIAASAQTTQYVSSLEAQTQQLQYNDELQSNLAGISGQTALAQISSATQTQMAQINQGLTEALAVQQTQQVISNNQTMMTNNSMQDAVTAQNNAFNYSLETQLVQAAYGAAPGATVQGVTPVPG